MNTTRLFAFALVLVFTSSIQARADFFKLDPRAAYLHMAANDTPRTPLILDLSTLSFSASPGRFLTIAEAGDYSVAKIGRAHV